MLISSDLNEQLTRIYFSRFRSYFQNCPLDNGIFTGHILIQLSEPTKQLPSLCFEQIFDRYQLSGLHVLELIFLRFNLINSCNCLQLELPVWVPHLAVLILYKREMLSLKINCLKLTSRSLATLRVYRSCASTRNCIVYKRSVWLAAISWDLNWFDAWPCSN